MDVEHIQWLQSYLKDYLYAFILISHDTEFMNHVSNVIFQLEFSKLTRYTASYEKFLELAEINKNQHINAYEKQQEFIKKPRRVYCEKQSAVLNDRAGKEPPETA